MSSFNDMIRNTVIAGLFCLLAACGGPTGPAPVVNADATPDGLVTVRSGDSAWLIARRHNVPLSDLIRLNGLQPPYHLLAGQQLRLPVMRLHRVRAGESLSVIAERYDVGRYDLARFNAIGPPYRIFPRQILRIPSATPVAQAASRAAHIAEAPPLPPRRPSDANTSNRVARADPAPRKSAPKPGPRAVPVPAAQGKLIWPVQGRMLSGFGAKPGGLHNDGVNIAANAGTPVRAAQSGTIVYAGNELRGFGNLVLIRHAGGLTTAYAHLDQTQVTRGQTVRRGDVIATVGSSGGADRPQLHFEIRRGRQALNPVRHLGPLPGNRQSADAGLALCSAPLHSSYCTILGGIVGRV